MQGQWRAEAESAEAEADAGTTALAWHLHVALKASVWPPAASAEWSFAAAIACGVGRERQAHGPPLQQPLRPTHWQPRVDWQARTPQLPPPSAMHAWQSRGERQARPPLPLRSARSSRAPCRWAASEAGA